MAPLPPPFLTSSSTSILDVPRTLFSRSSSTIESTIRDLHISSLELDRRVSSPSHSLVSRGVPAPPAGQPPGSINPYAVNNKGVLALFGLLSAGLVITSIWFFFWAKNGGFVFREGDWEDYKTTVLRRKDRHGKTLSNATKSTDLGGGSLTNEFDNRDDERAGLRGGAGRMGRRARDEDMREYRHEKPARVGGLNRKADGHGNHYTDHISSPADAKNRSAGKTAKNPPQMKETSKSRGFFHRAEKKLAQPKKAAYRHHVDDAYTELSSAPDSTPPRRQPARHGAHHAVPQASPTASPKHHHQQRHSRHYEPSETAYSGTTGYGDNITDDGDIGTKSYRHTIPGLNGSARGGKAMTEDSFERGERRGKEGYRRGDAKGRGRRDSLSDSD